MRIYVYVFSKIHGLDDYGLGAMGFTGVGGFNNLSFFSDFIVRNPDGCLGDAYRYYYNRNLEVIFNMWNYVFLGDPTLEIVAARETSARLWGLYE